MAIVRLESYSATRGLIDNISLHATTSVTEEVRSNITEYPVDEGLPVTDNIALSNTRISVVSTLSQTNIAEQLGRVDTFYSADKTKEILENIWKNRRSCSLYIYSKNFYDNLYISSMSFSKINDTYEIRIDFVQVRITTPQVALLPNTVKTDSAATETKTEGLLRQSKELGDAITKVNSQIAAGNETLFLKEGE